MAWRSIVWVCLVLTGVTFALPASAANNSADEQIGMLNIQVNRLYSRGQYEEALPLAQRYADAAKARYGESDPEYAAALSSLAQVFEALNRPDEAEPVYREVVQIIEKAGGARHANFSAALNNLAEFLRRNRKFAEAEPLYQRALRIDEKALGSEHTDVARDLNNLALLYHQSRRHGEAEPLYRRALKIDEAVGGPDHPDVAQDLHNLARLLENADRPAEAEPLLRRALAINESRFGPDHPKTARELLALGALFFSTNRLAEAEPLMRRALAINEARFGPRHPEVAQCLNNLAVLLQALNRLDEAEPLIRRTLEIDEASFGAEDPRIANRLNNLAMLLKVTNRREEAEPLLRRALKIDESQESVDPQSIMRDLSNLAGLLQDLGKLAEAEGMFRRAVSVGEASLGPDHSEVARDLNNLAALLDHEGRSAEAEPLYRRALKIHETRFGPNHPAVAITLNNLALALQTADHLDEAEALYQRALPVYEANYGARHPETTNVIGNLGTLKAKRGDWRGALELFRRVTANRLEEAHRLQRNLRYSDRAHRLPQEQANEFNHLALMAFRAGPMDSALRNEAFIAAQQAASSGASLALTQASARFAAGGGALAGLVREQQDLARQRDAADQLLLAAVAQANKEAGAEARRQLAKIDARLDAVTAELAQNFPEYAALADPQPISISQVQTLLEADEALVQFMDMVESGRIADQVFAWVITKTETRWVQLPIGTLSESVLALRCGLDPMAWRGNGEAGCRSQLETSLKNPDGPLPFDLARAHSLYEALFGQTADLIKGKKLLIAPSGALAAFPFHALVTESVSLTRPANWAGYRGVKWFGREHAITMAPSAASFAALRRTAKPSNASEPFIGFGAPALTGSPDCSPIAVPDRCPGETTASEAPAPGHRSWLTAALANLFRGGLADVEAVRKLCPLPDTEHELKCVARSLGAVPERLVVGAAATEKAIKAAPLERFRVVHFATHGLLSGESAELSVGSQAEPALVFTPPASPSPEDDGLLTASEVTQLKLDADWVVLSACNTAAGQKPGAEALSGLARAFFYAGARTLLVSHWPVDSNAATALTTGAFRELHDSPAIGPSEAMRRSMMELMDDRVHPWNAHPQFWAPFAVVGGGR